MNSLEIFYSIKKTWDANIPTSLLHLQKDNMESLEKALEDYDFLKRSLNRNWVDVINDDKKLKALEIIKEKRVNVSLFFSTDSRNDYNDYIARCRGAGIVREAQSLTQEEYDLLKGVLL